MIDHTIACDTSGLIDGRRRTDQERIGDLTNLATQQLHEIVELRRLIIEWADADDAVNDDVQWRDWDSLDLGIDARRLDESRDALRQAVGR